MAVTRSQIVEAARSWLGVAWVHQGRTREHGIDCVGLPVLVGAALGFWTPLPAAYPRRPNGTFVPYFKKYLAAKRIGEAEDADVLVFAEGRHPCHCGIRATLDGAPTVIHAHARRRRVVEEPLDIASAMIGRPILCFEFPALRA